MCTPDISRAFRRLVQLISRESEPLGLLRGGCRLLADMDDVECAWGLVVEGGGPSGPAVAAGDTSGLDAAPSRLSDLFAHKHLELDSDPAQIAQVAGVEVVLRLEHDGRLRALMGLSFHQQDAPTATTRALLEEWAVGLAFALGARQDIAEHELAEARLVESETNLASFINNTSDSIWSVDRDYNYLMFNHAYAEVFERLYGEQLVKGMHALSYMKPEDQTFWLPFTEAALQGQQQVFEFSYSFGEDLHYYQTSLNPIIKDGEVCGVAAMSVDVTALKRGEQALAGSNQRYRSLFDNSPMPLWEEGFANVGRELQALRERGVTDFRGYFDEHPEQIEALSRLVEILDVNKAGLRLHGARSKQELLQGLGQIFTESSYGVFKEQLIAIAEGKVSCESEGMVKTLAGETRDVLLNWQVVPGFERSLERVYISTLDMTERRRAEAERERLLLAIDQAAETILITDTEGRIEYVNPAFARTAGYSRDEVVGKNPRLIKSGAHDHEFYRDMWEVLSQGKVWRGRIINQSKGGERYTEEAVISPVLDSKGAIVNYVAVKRDITQELALEEQLLQSQKMEAIGRLAGGVAHDFNNMLSIILGYSEMLLGKFEPGHAYHELISEIQKATHRSADLTRQLLAFARKQTVEPKSVDLNQVMGGMVNMLERLLGEEIDTAVLPGRDLWSVKVDPGQVDQILANLCVNARDAIPGVGKVTIETGNRTFDEAYCRQHLGAHPGEFVMLAVSDDGCGMSAELQRKIFEPFFTTKQRGEGTGLGLATVYGIVKQNSGLIFVYSEPGRGTTFKIYLPRHHEAGPEDVNIERPAALLGGDETVLVVEDEAAILTVAREMLKQAGYEVLAARTPAAALELARQHAGDIDLLMTDVVMPEMNGGRLAKAILADQPSIRCLFMSGYTANVIEHRGILDEGAHFLQKPFSMQDLTAKVRAVLDEG